MPRIGRHPPAPELMLEKMRVCMDAVSSLLLSLPSSQLRGAGWQPEAAAARRQQPAADLSPAPSNLTRQGSKGERAPCYLRSVPTRTVVLAPLWPQAALPRRTRPSPVACPAPRGAPNWQQQHGGGADVHEPRAGVPRRPAPSADARGGRGGARAHAAAPAGEMLGMRQLGALERQGGRC